LGIEGTIKYDSIESFSPTLPSIAKGSREFDFLENSLFGKVYKLGDIAKGIGKLEFLDNSQFLCHGH